MDHIKVLMKKLCFTTRNLYRNFHRKELHIGDVDIYRGRMTTILGLSGCGKSTLLNLISGLDQLSPQDRGDLTFYTEEGAQYSWGVHTPPPSGLRRYLGFIFQSDELIDNYSSRTNILLPRMLFGDQASRDISSYQNINLTHTDLDENPGDLSGGLRSRISTLRSLAHSPEILLCDEPTSDLDPNTSHELMRSLEAWRVSHGTPKTVINISHSLDDSLSWSDDILVWSRPEEKFIHFSRDSNGWSRDDIIKIATYLDSPNPDAYLPHTLQLKPTLSDHLNPQDQNFFEPIPLPDFKDVKATLGLKDTVHIAFRDFWRHPRAVDHPLFQNILPLLVLLVTLSLYAIFMFSQGLDRGIEQYNKQKMENPIFRQTDFHFLGIEISRLRPLLKDWLALPDLVKEMDLSSPSQEKITELSSVERTMFDQLLQRPQDELESFALFNQLFSWFNPVDDSYTRARLDFIKQSSADQRDLSTQNRMYALGLALNVKSKVFQLILENTKIKPRYQTALPLKDNRSFATRSLILSDAMCKRAEVDPLDQTVVHTMREIEKYMPEYGQNVSFSILEPYFLIGCAQWMPTGIDFIISLDLMDLKNLGELDRVFYPNQFVINLSDQKHEDYYRALKNTPSNIREKMLSYIKSYQNRAVDFGEEINLDGFDVHLSTPMLNNGLYSATVTLKTSPKATLRLNSVHLAELAQLIIPDRVPLFLDPNISSQDHYRTAWTGVVPLKDLNQTFKTTLEKANSQGFIVDNTVVSRVESLKKIASTIKGFNRLSTILLNAILLAFLASLLVIDTLKKKRAYGVLKAIGFNDSLLFRLSIVQNAMIQIFIATLALIMFDIILLPILTPWISTTFLGISIKHMPFSFDLTFFFGFITMASILPSLFRMIFLSKSSPADLMRYRS